MKKCLKVGKHKTFKNTNTNTAAFGRVLPCSKFGYSEKAWEKGIIKLCVLGISN